MNYILHKIKSNERWDSIAYKYYSNAYLISPLIDANPHIAIGAILPENKIIKVPIKDYSSTVQDKSLLPPWKR